MDLIEIRQVMRRLSLPTEQTPPSLQDTFRVIIYHHITNSIYSMTIQSSLKQQVIPLSYLNAARYSASPMGGSSPPVNAMFTLKPTPAPLPTYNTHMHTCTTGLLCLAGRQGERQTGVPSHLVRCSTAREEVPVIVAMQ